MTGSAHGIGKQQFLLEETGAGEVDVMRQIKATLDPRNILNPGKILASPIEELRR